MNWTFTAAVAANGVILIYLAHNLKRWSTVDRATIPSNDFSAMEDQDRGATNFDFLHESPSPPTEAD